MIRVIVVISLLFPLLFPHPAYAHAFGQQYTLPVPFSLYAYGAAAAVIVSFLVVGFFLRETNRTTTYPSYDISRFKIFRVLFSKVFLQIIQVISVCLFLLTIVTGLFGTQFPTSNFNMTFFWIIVVLGLTYASALFGNIYAVLNPWKILTLFVEKVRIDIRKGIIKYPEKLGYYPALIFYFLFIWIELIGKVIPYELSIVLIAYTFVNYLGVLLIGERSWFTYGEFFQRLLRDLKQNFVYPVGRNTGAITASL